jgi:alpha-tubulin suppressor-like RCC1 family protein
MYGWGDNTKGQLGLGNIKTVNQFTLVPAPWQSMPIAVAAGNSHSLVLCSNGSVWGAGLNSSGQLGDFCNNISEDTEKKTVQFTQIILPNNRPVIKIAAGSGRSLLICDDGSVWESGSKSRRTPSGAYSFSCQYEFQMIPDFNFF